MDFGFQNGFLDFKVDFWISSGFLDFKVDFWIHLNRYSGPESPKLEWSGYFCTLLPTCALHWQEDDYCIVADSV